jgi:putative inorganic carbon (HCO3(-)) transporter
MFSSAAFVLLFIGCSVLAFMRSPMYGLGLYLATVYIHPPSRWWSYMLPDLRWTFIAGAIAVVAVLVHVGKIEKLERPWYRTVPGAALLIFVTWFWLQNLWALNPSLHFDYSVQFAKYVVAFYLVYRLATSPRQTTDILLMHVAGCTFLGLLCLYRGRSFGARLDGVGGPGMNDANTLGMYLATGLVVGAVLLLTLKGWRRIALIFALPVILNGVFYAGSRGAFLGMLAGGAMVFFLSPPRRRWVFWTFAALGIAAGVVLVDDKFVERMTTIRSAAVSTEQADGSTQGRLVLIEAQLKMAARYPHGAGFRGTAEMSREYLDARWLSGTDRSRAARSSHNTFMTALVDHGILGAVLYVWLTLWGAMAAVRVKAMQRRGVSAELTGPAAACCAGIAVVWSAGHFTDYLSAEVQFWLFAALAASLEQLRRTALRPVVVPLGTTGTPQAVDPRGAA